MRTSVSATRLGQQNWHISPWQCLTACCATTDSKAEWIGLWSFVFSIFTWPLTNQLPLLKHLNKCLPGKCFHNASSKMPKNAFKSLSNPTQGMDIYATGINRLSGEGSGYPLQYSYLENPMNRGAWQATVIGLHRVGHTWATKTHTQ